MQHDASPAPVRDRIHRDRDRGRCRVAMVGVIALAALGLAVPAGAHVTVSPGQAAQGGFATLTFKVPNERDDASTTTLEIEFPEDAPVASVSYQASPGWSVEVDREELSEPLNVHGNEVDERVATVTWRAEDEDAWIDPGQFGAFAISVGPLPEAEQMVFKALQTYSSGEVVRWIDEVAEDSDEEAERPAPVLSLTASDENGESDADSAATVAELEEVKQTAEEAKSAALEAQNVAGEGDGPSTGQVNAALGLAIGGIVLALIAAGLGGLALGRRSAANDAPPPAF